MAKREKKYLHKFVIDRATWKNGSSTTEGRTALLNDDGEKCCLGFLAESAGCDIDSESTFGYGSLAHLPEHDKALLQNACPSFVDSSRSSDTGFAMEMQSRFIDVNDDSSLSREKREEKLTKMFAEERVKVTFKGKYPAQPQADAPVQPSE